LIIPDHDLGSPVSRTLSLCACCRHCPGTAAGLVFARSSQPYQPSPKGLSGRPVHRRFRGLLSVHSHYGLHTRAVTVYRDTLSEGFSYFVTSIAAPAASGRSGYRVGLAPTGKRRILTAHTQSRRRWSLRFDVDRVDYLGPLLHNPPAPTSSGVRPSSTRRVVRSMSASSNAKSFLSGHAQVRQDFIARTNLVA
jgi:hypothetical protein